MWFTAQSEAQSFPVRCAERSLFPPYLHFYTAIFQMKVCLVVQ